MTAIEVAGLVKKFGPTTALDGVDLVVKPGEIVALVGPNGAGKTTLTRILGTTVLPDAGSARIGGYDVTTAPDDVRRVVGLVLSEERALFWRLTGQQNLEFFGALHGMGKRAARLRAHELLTAVELDDVADRRVDRYSTGMRARLGLARGLLGRPRVLLLDEPTRSLDPLVAVSARELIRRLVADQDIAVLFTTHDLHEASAMASRVLVLVEGRVVAAAGGGAGAAELESVLIDATRDP